MNSKSRRKRGITVFTSDDGRIEEYTIAKNIFENEQVPQTIAIVSDWVGSSNFLSVDQIMELQRLGWEIASHSKTHPSNPPMIDNPDNDFVEREFRESKQELIDMGFDVYNYMYPGGNYGKREREFAKSYYRAARNSDGGYHLGLNLPPLNSYELKTIWLDPSAQPMRGWIENEGLANAIAKIKERCTSLIDQATEQNGLAIISTHFANINTPELQLLYAEIIQYAKSKTMVTTLNDALNKMGNIIEIGDYSETGQRAAGENHYVVGVDGLISGSLSVSDRDRFNPRTPFSHFPTGVTVSPVYATSSDGAPNDRTGTLINFKPRNHSEGNGFGWQEYIIHTDRLYKFRRDVLSNSIYSDWYSDSSINHPEFNNYDTTSSFSEFPTGITFSRITGNNPNLSDSPEGTRGLLINIKPDLTSNSPSYAYQEYHIATSNRVYKRRVIDVNRFGDWFLISGAIMPSDNEYNIDTPFSSFPIGVTYSIVQNHDSVGSPIEGKNGTLITHKLTDRTIYGYSFQEYHVFNSPTGETWKRFAQTQSTWGEWINVN
nr:polysaccharide deacetylase family protein [Gracilibacillus alcaliphilus]